MALNYPPIGYTGENVEGSNQSTTKPGIVRAATAAEAGAGTRNDIFISPATIPGFSVPVTVPGGGTGLTSATAHGVVVGEGTSAMHVTAAGTDGQVLIAATGADPAFATLTSTDGSVGFTAGTNTLDLKVQNGGMIVSEVTGTSQAMAINTCYIANNAGLVTLTLPATAALGSVIKVDGKGAGGWKIAQNSGQIIHGSSSATTSGATGHLDSGNQWDSVTIRCVTANTTWVVEAAVGTLSYT